MLNRTVVFFNNSQGKYKRNECLINVYKSDKDLFCPCICIRQYKYKGKRTASDLSTIRTASDSSTIQFRLIFKGHKSLEYTGVL